MEKGEAMIMYYLLVDPTLHPSVNTYWRGDNSRAGFLTELRGFVIPLGTRKPRNVSHETIREF